MNKEEQSQNCGLRWPWEWWIPLKYLELESFISENQDHAFPQTLKADPFDSSESSKDNKTPPKAFLLLL